MYLTYDVYAEIRDLARHAWERQLLSGFNGNVSIRVGEHIAITRSGAAKGYLQERDVCILDATGQVIETLDEDVSASSEGFMHVQIYAQRLDVQAIVHCHPRHLLALEMKLGGAERTAFLHMPVFEADMLRARLGFVADFSPGTQALAEAVGVCSVRHDAIWMSCHGLTCVGKSGIEALALAEELDHLAATQLLAI